MNVTPSASAACTRRTAESSSGPSGHCDDRTSCQAPSPISLTCMPVVPKDRDLMVTPLAGPARRSMRANPFHAHTAACHVVPATHSIPRPSV